VGDEEKSMRIAVTIVRILMGLLFLFASITYLFKLIPVPELTGDVKKFNEGLMTAVYIMPLVKVIELLSGIAFITGRYVALAVVVLFPVIVNIFLFHTFLAPEGLPVAIFVLLGNSFLAYANRDKYKPLLAPK
jgi:putative oxidoreductase